MIEKPARKRNKALLAAVRREPCQVNRCTRQAQPAHIKSRGAGGDDTPGNLVPLCDIHHAEQHIVGWVRFRQLHPEIRSYAEILKERRKRNRLGGERKDDQAADI